MGKIKLKSNLTEAELEDYLVKALRGVQHYQEPKREFPDRLANMVKDEANQTFGKVVQNMLHEIREVIADEK